MIVDAIMSIVVGILSGVLSLVPTFGGVDLLHDSHLDTLGTTIGTYAGKLNGYVPVTVVATCVGFFLAVRVVTTVWTVLVWVYDRIPFKAT